MSSIRAKSVCLFRHNGRILLAEGYDPGKDEHYYIPVGGGVEFGGDVGRNGRTRGAGGDRR